MPLEEQLNTFMEQWHGTHITAYEDCLVYNVVHGFAKSASYRAIQLIAELDLSLTAEVTSDSTFIIKSLNNEKAGKN